MSDQKGKNPWIVEKVSYLHASNAKYRSRQLKKGYPKISPELVNAIKNKDLATVQKLISQKDFDPTALSPKGETALHCAARFGTPEMLEALIKAGVNVDTKDIQGFTPMHNAVLDLKMTETLLNAGADPTITSRNGSTALLHACSGVPRKNQDEIIKKVLSYPGVKDQINNPGVFGYVPVFGVARNGSNELLDAFIQAGADVNAVSATKETILHFAAGNKKDPNVLTNLVNRPELKDKINMQDREGMTPLHVAVQNGTPEQVKALLQAGADKSIKNNEGKTARDLIEEGLKNEKDPTKKAELEQMRKLLSPSIRDSASKVQTDETNNRPIPGQGKGR